MEAQQQKNNTFPLLSELNMKIILGLSHNFNLGCFVTQQAPL